jgi:hypothetical protein
VDGRGRLERRLGSGAVVARRGARGDGRFRLRLRFGVGLGGASETLGVGETAHAVGLRILDARGVALDADPQAFAEIEGFLVGKPELSRQLVDPDPLVRHLRSNNPFR